MTNARFGNRAGNGPAIAAGDGTIGFVPAVYGPSGRWYLFALGKAALLIYAGGLLGTIGVRSARAGIAGWGPGAMIAVAFLAIVLAVFALVHLCTRKVAVDAEEIEFSGGLGMTSRRLRRDDIAGWRIALGREFDLEDTLSRSGTEIVTLYPKESGGKRLSLAMSAFDFDENFDHWLASMPRIIERDALRGGDQWEELLHDPLFAPLIAMVALLCCCIVLLTAFLAAGVI